MLLYILAGFVFLLLLIILFLKKRENRLEGKIERLQEINTKLQLSSPEEQLGSNVDASKTSFVLEQIKKIESLESELKRQKKQVEDARDIAQEGIRLKHSFLTKINTKLQIPLQSIIASSVSLNKQLKDKALLRELHTILENGRNLSVALGEIIKLSKLDSSAFSIDTKAVDVRELFEVSIQKYRSKAEKKELRLELVVDDEVPHSLMLDANKVQEILCHLIENSLEFTQSGFVKVHVKVLAEHLANNVIDLSIVVEDSGCGIDEKVQAEIFNVFENRATLDAMQDVGMGLSINKKVAKRMDGDLTLFSEPSKGSAFTLTLLGLEIVLSGAQESDDALHVDFSLLDKNACIVVIDEDDEVKSFISENFSSASAEIFMYDHVRDSMETLKKKKIDLIFIDAEVYHMDEGAVSKVIANMNSAVVVALTSKSVKDIALNFEGIRPSEYLKKPLSKLELFKVALKVLN